MPRDTVNRFLLDRYPAYTELPYPHATDRITAYCAEEVRRQGDSPWHVFRMLKAWEYAREIAPAPITKEDILALGRMIDEENEDGFRDGDIFIGGGKRAAPELISGMIAELIREQDNLAPQELYWRFEMIHPFFDGNGRTGKVLFNWKNGSLNNPVWPKAHPSWGDISNP